MPRANQNPLAHILIRPRFIDAATCQRIVETLNGRAESSLGVGADNGIPDERPLSTAVSPGDLVAPIALLVLLKTPGSLAQRIVGPLLAAHAATLARARTVTDVPDEVAFALLAGLTGLVRDPAFLSRHRGSFDLASHPPLEALFELLRSRGVLDADGAPRDLSLPGARQAIEWLNVGLLEALVLPGALKKRSRLFRADLSELAGLELGGSVGLPARADLLEALDAASKLFASPAQVRVALASITVHDAQLERQRELLRDHLDDARAAYALHLALAATRPELFASPGSLGGANGGRATIESIRKVQTVDWSDLRPTLNGHVERFVRDEMAPYYGVTRAGVADSQLLKTTHGGYYRAHNDSETREVLPGGVSRWRKDKKNDIAVVLYLSRANDYEGGALMFPELNVKVVPQQGMAIAFPGDHRFFHCVEQVTSGARWAIASWLDCVEAPPIGAIDPSDDWYARR